MELEFRQYLDIWQGQTAQPELVKGFPGWPDKGIAIMGDFSGIQGFVYRPVPGVGGAAKRLRSRSFRVSAYTEMIVHWFLDKLRDFAPEVLYSAGGRFLLRAAPIPGWDHELQGMRRAVDLWAWKLFEGELVFHISAAEFKDSRVPHQQLLDSLEAQRLRPLASVLQGASGWEQSEFFRSALDTDARCKGCGKTAPVGSASYQKDICDICNADTLLGSKIPFFRFARLVRGNLECDLLLLDFGMQLLNEKIESSGSWLAVESPSPGTRFWPLLRNVPTDGNEVLDFDEIARRDSGPKKWLGYLRLDIDHAGREFEQLKGDPLRTWSLSRLLHLFLTLEAGRLIRNSFSDLYAVYGGGDDVFVIGPWQQVLDYAVALRQRLRDIAGDALTFSAGMALAKPREHILTKAQEAGKQLLIAKEDPAYGRRVSRDQIRVLGTTADWVTFVSVLETAKKVKKWFEERQISARFLQQLLDLHEQWSKANAGHSLTHPAARHRYRYLMHYQIQRNISGGPAREWALSLLKPQSQWPWANFIARYALLSAQRDEQGE